MTMNVVIVDDTHINLVLMPRLVGKLDDVQTFTFQAAQQGDIEALEVALGDVCRELEGKVAGRA